MNFSLSVPTAKKVLAFIIFLIIIFVIYWMVKQIPLPKNSKQVLVSTPSAGIVTQAESFNLTQKVEETVLEGSEEISGEITKVEGNKISVVGKDYILSPTVQVFEVKGSPTLSREEIMEKKVAKPMDLNQSNVGNQVKGFIMKEMSKDEISILIIFKP